jgi:hypothetical protein
MINNKVEKFIKTALECSIYLAPLAPGLTYEEILELGKNAGFQAGEIGDALPKAGMGYIGQKTWHLNPDNMLSWQALQLRELPDYRNLDAFDFITDELQARVKADGIGRAQLARDTMVERGVAKGFSKNDLQAAITIFVMTKHLTEKDTIIRFRPGMENWRPFSEQQSQLAHHPNRRTHDETREKIYEQTKDIIARRTDGRPLHANSLDAFTEQLDKLGFKKFRLWWTQTVGELRRLDTMSSPVSALVLSAALVEGVLIFVVKHARTTASGTLGSKDFNSPSNQWKFDDLVKSAAHGNDPILSASAKAHADALNQARQRIHAGRMLVDFPEGVPDLKPEEAVTAIATANLVVRAVLDWLEKYPPAVA